ncbi:MAG TPA: hypothetical protein VLE91_01805 [Candidatus Saccharimonadales bacterium]|nr:hypothetical protein [Candidatus Saccharimonadales bacterium]
MTSEGDIPNHVLDEARDFVARLKAGPEDEGIIALHEEIDQFGPQARSFLQFLTNSFLEQDILEKTLGDPESVQEIRQKFASFGVGDKPTGMVIEYFSGKLAGQNLTTQPSPNN